MLLYFEAEQFVANDPKNASLRSRVFDAAQSKKVKSNPKQVLALVSSTLKYKQYLKEIIKHAKLLKTAAALSGSADSHNKQIKKKLTLNLSMLLVHDLLFTKSGRIQSSKHPVKDFVLSNKTRLHSEFIKLKLKYKVKDFSQLVSDGDGEGNDAGNDNDYTPVRWFRINTIKATVDSVFKEQFFQKLVKVDTFEELKKTQGNIYHDVYIPNLFGINPREKITNTNAYKTGKIIIQDRSSCFPAHILNPSPGDKIIDCCSAPGNKTTHAASYIRNTKRSITAFEKNKNRSKVLQMMVDRAGASKCVTVKNCDFTITDPKQFPDVVGFIVDPSCSGSGIFGREKDDQRNKQQKKTGEEAETQKDVGVEAAGEEEEEEEMILNENENDDEDSALVKELIKSKDHDPERLAKLSSFQFAIVKHALLFPSAKKLVYLTCSIHPEENEQVVIDLLNDAKVQAAGWRLCERKDVLPTWARRGWKLEFVNARFSEDEAAALAEGCVRSLPKVDGGIGFFAAAFEKLTK